MADVFTNDLRIREQESGSNAGTWGGLLNTTIRNIASAFGQGSEAIPDASTHTITLADGVADEARSMYLKCTGGGQACTVTLAPNTISKVWIISNETSFTLTFTQGSGANVSVAAGATKMIVTDGAGSGAALTDALSGLEGSLSTLAVTGALTVDTTTLVVDATNNNVGIGVTPEAYTVFNPVLRIKNTNTGGGGTLAGTSADNFRMFANTFYDGAYKRLATGFATQYGQESGSHVWSYAASGAADSTFTWSEVMRTSGGNFGIGNSSPAYTLTVQKDVDDFIAKIENDGNSTTSNGLWVDTRWNTSTNTVFQVTTNSGAQPVIVAKGNGSVGIGTSSPDTLLHLSGADTAVIRLENSDSSLGANQLIGGVEFEKTDGSGAGVGVVGGMRMKSDSSVGAATYLALSTSSTSANDVEAMRITAARDMYFGQTSGSAADVGIILQAAGNIFATVDGGPPLLLRRNTSDGEMLRFSKNSSIVGTISTNANSLPSDRNFKTNINYDFDLGLEFVTSLKPVTYNYKIDNEGAPVMSGLIAQDVEESLSAAGVEKNSMTMLQHIPTGDEEQSDYQMDYLKLVPVLINAIKEQQLTITALTERIETLEQN